MTNDLVSKFKSAVELHRQGKLTEARAGYEAVLIVAPSHTDALANLGALLRAQGDIAAGIALLERAHRELPAATNVSFNLGNAYYVTGQHSRAIEIYKAALTYDATNAMLWYSIGKCHQDLREHQDAEIAYRKSLELNPQYYDSYLNLASALGDQGRVREAIAVLKQATQLQPEKAPAWNNLGLALQEAGEFDASVDAYKKAFALEPSYRIASNILMGLQYCLNFTDAQLVQSARSFGSSFPAKDPIRPAEKAALHLGFVSADLYAHPVGFFLRPVIKELVRRKISCTFYSNGQRADEITQELKSGNRWRDIGGMNDQGVAQQIRKDGITVLIDLSGHSAKNRLPVFAQRPAPLQLSWLGYFATTGLAQMDAIVMDPWHAPAGSEVNFTEQVLRLPKSRFCYAPPDYATDVKPPPCISTGVITFGSFNNTSKINDQVVALWCRVLNVVPRSRLLLKWRSFEDKSFIPEFLQRFARHGISADRIELRGQSVHRELLDQYADMDIALDPFPFTGGQTSCEALWMGVPVVTLPRNRPVSRQTLCFLQNIGRPEWVATNADEYVAIAQRLASNPMELARLRATQREEIRASPLCDAKRFTDDLLAAIAELERQVFRQ